MCSRHCGHKLHRVNLVWSGSYLQMSWLEGETDVLEKLHGALTEVGLPAWRHTGGKKITDRKHNHSISQWSPTRNNFCIIQNWDKNHIFWAPKKGPVWWEQSDCQCLNLIFTERTSRTDAQDNKKGKTQHWQLIYLIKAVSGKICLSASWSEAQWRQT